MSVHPVKMLQPHSKVNAIKMNIPIENTITAYASEDLYSQNSERTESKKMFAITLLKVRQALSSSSHSTIIAKVCIQIVWNEQKRKSLKNIKSAYSS